MAFNFLGSFQKNQRFWMAAILLVCIFTFVFCTGGVDSDRLLRMIVRPRGTSIATVGGRSISETELGELKQHRKLADSFMLASADHAIRRLSAEIFAMSKKDDEKNAEVRREKLFYLTNIRDSIVAKRSKPRYFEIGDKFDDLLEFKMWQAIADRLNIRLEDDHVEVMYFQEFFGKIDPRREVPDAQRQAMNNAGTREISNAAFFRAVGEEFRVRIAQLAVAEGQTFSFFGRSDPKNPMPKYFLAEFPDELRAPMTLAQIVDTYKKYRAEFNVSLLPVPVEAFLAKANDPNELEKNSFFANNKSKPIDPSSPEWGLAPPQQIRFEYVYADPKSPVYSASSKTVTYLSVLNLTQVNPLQSALLTAVQLAGNSKMVTAELVSHHKNSLGQFKTEPVFGSAAWNLPIVFHYASKNPEAGSSLLMSATGLSTGGLSPYSGLANCLAWGPHKNRGEIDAAMEIESNRRSPMLASFFASCFAESPYVLAGQLAAAVSIPIDDSPFKYQPLFNAFGFNRDHGPYTPLMPVPEVSKTLLDGEAAIQAEAWAQSNMIQVRRVLDGARGDIEKIRRELNRLVPTYNLTHGPTGDAKYTFYNRHTIKDAKDLDFLKTTFARYTEVVNQFENLDAASGTRINPGEFYRMFFDNAKYSATTKDVVVAWPPKVVADNKRIHMKQDPRRSGQVSDEVKQMFQQYVDRHDPNLPIPELDLFAQSPDQVLYWRTAELSPIGLTKYSDIDNEIAKVAKEKKSLEAELQTQKDSFKAEEIRDKIAAAKQTQIDLQTIKDRVDLGFRVDKAKANAALPKVLEIAKKLASRDTITQVARTFPEFSVEIKSLLLPGANEKLSDDDKKKRTTEADRKSAVVELTGISMMNPEQIGREVDYTAARWPKEQLANVREEFIANLSQLPDLLKPIVTGNKDLDRINKELFDEAAKKEKEARIFVQIIPNVAQDVFYVAAVTSNPDSRLQKDLFRRSRSLADAFGGSFMRSPQRDLLLDRFQERHAKEYRQQLVRGIREVVGFELTKDGEEMRKKFDERGD